MHSSAIEHLRRTDPALAKIIDEVGDCRMTPRAPERKGGPGLRL